MIGPQSPPAVQPGTDDPTPPHARLFTWKRGGPGLAVILLLFALQSILPGPPRNFDVDHTAARMAVMLVIVPTLMLTLSLSYRWAARRRLGSVATLFLSVGVALGTGSLAGSALWLVVHKLGVSKIFAPNEFAYPTALGFGATLGILLCGIWVLVFVHPFAAEDARIRALEAEHLKIEAEKLRVAAELAHLRAQLEPHFLLNTLNTIASLVVQNPREARRLLGCLGDLLGDALRDPEEMQTLGQEIAWLRRYAEILESRHSESLHFEWEVEDTACDVLLPRLLLQPLVENAVKHGALHRDRGGKVKVQASLTKPTEGRGSRLICTVEDNGPGMPIAPPRSGAFGLRAVRRRLELKYPDARLGIESSENGTRMSVDLPDLRTPGVAL